MTKLFDIGVSLWHLAVLNPAMARARNVGTKHLMFGAYPRERSGEVEHRLRSVVESNRGRLLPAADVHRVWGERYFPIRPAILPAGFPGSPANSPLWPSCPRSWSRWRIVLRASPYKAPSPVQVRSCS